jgi:phosphate transport system substrate-binding protein
MILTGRVWRPVVGLVAIVTAGVFAGCEVKSTPVAPAPPKASGDSPRPDPQEASKPSGGEMAANDSSKSPAADVSAASTKEPDANKSSEGEAATISAEGSSTVYPICQAFAVEFEKNSKHTVSVGMIGTGSGYKKFLNRQADIWNASRPIDPKEVTELAEKGIEWLELNIAVDGIVIAVNPKNDWCSEITCAQLKRIWEPDSKVKTWNDLDPKYPSEPILLYGADTESGTFEYFTEVINGKKKATNINYTPAANDNVLVQGIASNKSALGYIPFGYYVENTEKLKALSVSPTKELDVTPAPFVEPTEETILSREYSPLARPLFMYVNKKSLKRPEVAAFMTFAVSKEAQPLVGKRGFVKVTKEDREKAAATLEAAIKESAEVK